MRVHLGSLAGMRTFAEELAGHLRAGDLLILTGNLGAGKTTFTQSLGRALDVSGRITSPTFIIAREHPSRSGGPALVHVDAYRLADGEELEDLDLDSEFDESITVVEWGAGLAEQLSTDYLEITITPVWAAGDMAAAVGEGAGENDTDDQASEAAAGTDADEDADDESGTDADDEIEYERRTVVLTGHGDSWSGRMARVQAAISALEGITTEGDAS